MSIFKPDGPQLRSSIQPPVDTRDAEQIDEEQAAAEAKAEEPRFGLVGVTLLCTLSALDCIMTRLRVEDSEFQAAVRRRFAAAGVPLPDEMLEEK